MQGGVCLRILSYTLLHLKYRVIHFSNERTLCYNISNVEHPVLQSDRHFDNVFLNAALFIFQIKLNLAVILLKCRMVYFSHIRLLCCNLSRSRATLFFKVTYTLIPFSQMWMVYFSKYVSRDAVAAAAFRTVSYRRSRSGPFVLSMRASPLHNSGPLGLY